MTPHDELMALAGKWDLRSDPYSGKCAADLRALLDSDAFRAMVRDGWHSVSEKLPADGDVVLCYESRKGNQFVSQFMAEMPGGKPGFMEEFYEKAPTTDGCAGGYGHWPFVTHWRPPPAPPQAIDAAASGATSEGGRDE